MGSLSGRLYDVLCYIRSSVRLYTSKTHSQSNTCLTDKSQFIFLTDMWLYSVEILSTTLCIVTLAFTEEFFHISNTNIIDSSATCIGCLDYSVDVTATILWM